ncbi:hypothetical protein [Isoptericola halotolerans]|uniref:Uncharacterized protein n=1 Tax=Isoptericola halotolerans TaxID=300560 RepID=A0ABX2A9C2_9MICO|nr:hypothetical protein [Isoptericola halotolerans]NOV98522.1 hypothetical protein [Isoptericola halotolerans]
MSAPRQLAGIDAFTLALDDAQPGSVSVLGASERERPARTPRPIVVTRISP